MGAYEEVRSKRKINVGENKELRNEFQIEAKSSQVKDEVFTGHKPIPIKIVNKVMKSICKITVKTKEGIVYGTGFFLNYSYNLFFPKFFPFFQILFFHENWLTIPNILF